jgi:hypothetical protein
VTEYVKSTNFASKDSLSIGNPLKIVKGTEIDTEFNNIATAVATKADIVSPTFTGTPLAPTATAGTNTTQLATTAFVTAAVTAYDTALTVSTAQIEDAAVTTNKVADNAITNAKLAGGNVPALLGFTPVQQGTGTGQLSNIVKIGWSGSQLKAQVDATDMGPFAMQSNFTGGNQSIGGSGYQKLPGGLIMQWGVHDNGSFSGNVGASGPGISFPLVFPNALLNLQLTEETAGGSTSTTSETKIYSRSTSSFQLTGDVHRYTHWFAVGY